MDNYLEVRNLSKSFADFRLHDITFTVPKGYIMGLIGPNGSGKTTTIKLILNMSKRTNGEVKILGFDNIACEQEAKEIWALCLTPIILVTSGRSHRSRSPYPLSMKTGIHRSFQKH